MIRRKVLDQRLDRIDRRLDDVRDAVCDRNAAEEEMVARTADAERRVAAAQTQAEARVAAVTAELAAARQVTIRNGIADLRAELSGVEARLTRVIAERDEAIGRAEHAEAEHARLLEAWQARGEQVDDYCRQLGDAERRLEVLADERDEARRQHDECRAAMHEATDSCNANLAVIGQLEHERSVLVDERDALADAVRDVLDRGDHQLAIAARPKGGSRTRTRARFARLAELTGWGES